MRQIHTFSAMRHERGNAPLALTCCRAPIAGFIFYLPHHNSVTCLVRGPAEMIPRESYENLTGDYAEEKTPKREEKILCRECGQVITSPSESIDIEGSHQHTFANPAGRFFRIGCFSAARGCLYAGAPTEQWSWFRGFSWRVAVCSSCFTHLGWHYLSSGHESFHGLILSCLAQTN